MRVAFLGLGVMGFPMAGHLRSRGGHEVTVFNRTAAKAEAWSKQHGGEAKRTPREAPRAPRSCSCASETMTTCAASSMAMRERSPA
jgi:3-hydroxyisobutyrate dehydrogenase-like beta-hydroxyacid dehydrogenase